MEDIARKIVDASFHVHKELGPGLLESAYQFCLVEELYSRDLQIKKEVPLPLVYKGKKLDCGYRIDILVENKILIELKSVEQLMNIHLAQTITYLRLSGLQLGFLINFNVPLIKDGIRRVVNNYRR